MSRVIPRPRDLLALLLLALSFSLLSTQAASAESSFNGNSCTSSTFCMVVGSTGNSGSAQILIDKWNGTAWTKSSYSNPAGATSSRLNSVDCISTTSCVTVGSYVDSGGTTHSLALKWNGTTWSSASVPEPSGAKGSHLAAIDCLSSADCRAVGTYTDSGGVEKTLALSWNGTTWSIVSSPNISGAQANSLKGIACHEASYCIAVGSHVNSSGVTVNLSLKWNGTAWSLISTGNPSGYTYSTLVDVYCIAKNPCLAVGHYTNSSGVKKMLIMNWNETTWSIFSTTDPSGSTDTRLSTILCTSTSLCRAFGSYNKGGSESFPLMMIWNGTAWSEQSLPPSESLAAHTASISSAVCPPSSICQAVGSVTYGQSGANRAFAFLLSGGEWTLSGADGYQRAWSNVELPVTAGEDTAQKADVFCTSNSFCMRVGASLKSSTPTSRAKTWNGTSWTKSNTVSPSGAKASELTGVVCTSSTACRAVGSYVDSAGVTKPLSLSWNGTAWSVTTTPVPAGASSSRLNGITCLSASDCRAVGSYVASGVTKTLAMSWNGTSWSIVTTPNPASATASQLLALACTSSTLCRAVGSYTESGTTKTLAMNWNGTAWSIVTSTNVSGAKETVLQGISCASSTFCLAVGYSVNSESKKQQMAEKHNGTMWATAADTSGWMPTHAMSEFSDVACFAYELVQECRAVGRYADGSGESEVEGNLIAQRYEQFGTWYWVPEESEEAPAVNRSGLSGFSCPNKSECVAVGRTKYKEEAWEDTANHGVANWNLEDPPHIMMPLRGVDCPSSILCIAVGEKLSGSVNEQRVWKKEGATWSKMTTPVVAESGLYDIACSDSTHCTTVGFQNNKTLAERWNGSSWSVQTTPNPEPNYWTAFHAVDCATTTNCMAVGSRLVSESGTLAPFSAEWNGTIWTIRKVPRRAGSTDSDLGSVSCPTAEFCLAIGSWENKDEPVDPVSDSLLVQWDGTDWHQVPLFPLEGYGDFHLTSVSCTTTTACTAVGTTEKSGPAAFRWDGTSWTIQENPSNPTALSAGPAAVECLSSTNCIWAGSESPDEHSEVPLSAGWDGSVWFGETVPSKGTYSRLTAVSCRRAVDCVAVGTANPDGRNVEFALQSTEAANQEVPDTTIVSGPSGTVTSVQQTFNFASTEAGGGYQCSLDGGAFAACTPPKSYTLSNGAHTFKVRANDIAGNVDASPAERTFTVAQPPETTITSPTPSYTNHEEPPITFTAGGSGLTFKCSLDDPGEQPKTTCSSPYAFNGRLSPGWHTFVVGSVDKSGKVDSTPAKWTFNTESYPAAPSTSELVYPEEGKKTASHYTLKAEWGNAPEGGGVTGVTFQMMLPDWKTFKAVPAECVIDGKGQQVSWPLAANSNPGQSAPVFLKVGGCAPFKEAGYPEEEIKFRAVFDGGKNAAGASEPAATEYVYKHNANRAASNATASVGPGTLDLLTGAYTISRTDVSIPVPGSQVSLEFTRVYDSTLTSDLPSFTTVLGSWWQPSTSVEGVEGTGWRKLEERVSPATEAEEDEECWDDEGDEVPCGPANVPCDEEHNCYKWTIEDAHPEERRMELIGGEGVEYSFKIVVEGGVERFIAASEEAKDLTLIRQDAEHIVLTESEGTRTTFLKNGSSAEYFPETFSFQASPTSARMVYDDVPWVGLRLSKQIAPAAPGIDCSDATSTKTPGCRTLEFHYLPKNHWTKGGYPEWDKNLSSITYYNATGNEATAQPVAEYNYGPYAELIEEWDPRLPGLKEKYGYKGFGSVWLTSLIPPGEEPWEFEYETGCCAVKSALTKVSRASLVEGEATATTTIAYNVPISGSGAPYDMSPSAVAAWGQADYPVDATAIFPPSEVPSSPPSSYAKATIKYMDPDGRLVNTASPQLPGASGPSITTSETDEHGNVVRALGAQARLTALASPDPVERSHELESKSKYSADGIELLEQWGPLHEVRLQSGAIVEARAHSTFKYNEGATEEALEEYGPHLVTTVTSGARIPGQVSDLETRTTKIEYDWKWLKPTAEIVDPSGLNLKTSYVYNGVESANPGLLKERRLPGTPGGGDARTTKTIYYTAQKKEEAENLANCVSSKWANLPCKREPAAQPTPAESNPQLPIITVAAYSNLDQPTEIKETTGGVLQRTTTKTYDSAGRPVKTKTTGTGTSIPATETVYNSETGRPFKQQFVCEAPESCIGFDNQALTTTFDALGRPEKYEDADGNKSLTLYDIMGRPFYVSDGKGNQTITYDSTTGVPTQIVDSAAGTFTASYNADGQIVAAGLPNGLTAETTYDETGTPIHKRYQKTTSCSSNCTWFDFGAEESIHGQWLKETTNLESSEFGYDKAGRLTLTKERPEGTSCTTRSYAYDSDSNRTKLTTRAPGAGGACDTTSAGTVKNYSYDTGDRLIGSGIVYDKLGRITSLPSAYSGGGTLTSSYYVNELIRSQTQDGLTNTYDLDAFLRQRKSTQTGTKSGSSIFHYAGASDSPAWIDEGAKWTRNIGGFEGLAAIQESSGATTLQLSDLHGDIVATASLESGATAPLSTFKFDEFGNPNQSNGPRYGWLGGKGRRTELSSGVVQMGVRSYVPAVGRFLSPDSVIGGSANAYDYANADPVNVFDLGGTNILDPDPENDCKRRFAGGACTCGLHVRAWSNARQQRFRGTVGFRIHFFCPIPGGSVARSDVQFSIQRRLTSGGDWSVVILTPSQFIEGSSASAPSNENDKEKFSITRHFRCDTRYEYRIRYSFKGTKWTVLLSKENGKSYSFTAWAETGCVW